MPGCAARARPLLKVWRHTNAEPPMSTVENVAAFMHDKALVLATAESCTAGLISALLADVPGAGAVLDCAFVVYSPEAKQRLLGVRAQTLARFNLTSEQVAIEMAIGAVSRSDANVAVSNTGVADSTDDDIPAGTQCFAWAYQCEDDEPAVIFSETRRFHGDRHEIRHAAAHYALARIPHYYRQFSEEVTPDEQPVD
jgi:PncC family amidohydrolase